MIFKMQIDLGNEAMQHGTDVARALRDAAQRIEQTTGEDD